MHYFVFLYLQTRVSLDAGSVLVNVSLDTQQQTNSNTVQACVLFSSQQVGVFFSFSIPEPDLIDCTVP